MKLLIVEDFKTFNNSLAQHCQDRGYEVSQAFTLAEAHEKLARERFDFILLDLILPDGEGEDIVYQKRFGLEGHIIVFTADDDAQRRENLFGHGILDYISKQNPYEYIIKELDETMDQLSSNAQYQVMVVDDSGFIRKMIAEMLSIRGYQTAIAKNGQEALEMLSQTTPDLMILDLEMPDINGERVLLKMRQKKELLDLPVIVLSGTTNKDMVARVMKHGADDFIAKPFSVETLMLKVRLFVKMAQMGRALKESNTMLGHKVEEALAEKEKQSLLLIQQSRMAAMGEMIGNIAHQWRQPLNALGLLLQNMQRYYDRGRLGEQEVEHIHTKGMRLVSHMSDTIDSFRDFFRSHKEKRPFQLSDDIHAVLELIGPALEHANVQLKLEIDEDAVIMGHANEFSQVVLNILQNARDALLSQTIGKKWIRIALTKRDQVAEVLIEDSAGGIPEEVLPRIFEPYFTTKEEGKGTGIGLYMSKTIIEQNMGGIITAENGSEGACFTIRLPIYQAAEQ